MPDPAANELAADTRRKTLCPMMVLAHRSGPLKLRSRSARLVRAADLIGQLGDPHYLRKANALYYEFEEIGMNRREYH